MRSRRDRCLAAALLVFAITIGGDLRTRAQEPSAMAPRTASYSIDATLDPLERTITGREIVTWRNPGTIPAYSIRLHLYWNAWRNTDSTWLRQRALAGLNRRALAERTAADFGWQQVTALRLVNPDGTPGADMMASFRYISPTDQNRADRSLAAADLPVAVPPGQSVRMEIGWRAQIPRTFARTGGIGHYFFIAQWFPKLGVFEGDGWNARQFFANTEFYADFGAYDVRLTVPRGWIVGATGRELSRTDAGDTTVHRYAQGDVHDFAWTTSPDFLEREARFEHPTLPPVTMRLLLQPEHAGQEERHFAATRAALQYYGEWYGAYPYPQITIVDPAWQSGSGGMEYPTLFTAGSRWLAPRGSNEPEGVTVHEAGHQFWYGMVASNEVMAAWMDEGLNTFSDARVQDVAFQPDYYVQRFFGGFIPWQFRDIRLSRATDYNYLNSYREAARRDAPITPSYLYWPGTHSEITYSKTALWLNTLERLVGWEKLRPALATYFERFRFKHPVPDDFFRTMNEEIGQDLNWFFEEAYGTANVYDYAAERLDSAEVETRGFDDGSATTPPAFHESHDDKQFHTTVVVRRIGEGHFPVDVLVSFENGEQVREKWDGQARWQPYEYVKSSKAVSVQVDPDRVLLLDVNYTNNSITLKPRADDAADRWSLTWIVWLQDLLMNYAFFV